MPDLVFSLCILCVHASVYKCVCLLTLLCVKFYDPSCKYSTQYVIRLRSFLSEAQIERKRMWWFGSNIPHLFIYLNNWFQVSFTIWWNLGDVALVQDVHQYGLVLRLCWLTICFPYCMLFVLGIGLWSLSWVSAFMPACCHGFSYNGLITLWNHRQNKLLFHELPLSQYFTTATVM